jgi:hypothetical protein
MKGSRRKSSALASIAQRRVSLALTAPNLQTLVRVYMLDGSSKVLQMMEKSTVSDVLKQLKFNLDLDDISTCALFRVRDGVGARRLELREVIKDVMKDVSDHDYTSGTTPKDTVKGIDGSASKSEVRILFRTWIAAKCGVFEKEIFQDHLKHKSPTSALYLAYMEANFMCFTGRYYLSEDEAIMLGCLKMQADSGDFDSDVHTVENVQHRVCTAFPRPISTRMKALLSPTISGGGNKAYELAEKVQFLYARLAGKHKAEAQIEFLHTLRTWCPFYGATFFDVQCQYDDGDADEEPAVSTITVAIGPLAIFLITRHDNQLTILRHPYKRIVKWVAYSEKHIFNYWTIKQDVSLRDIEEAQQAAIAEAAREGKDYDVEEEFDATPYCDCIYLVTPNCAELEYLVRSYVALLKYDRYPCLAGATDELLSPDISEWYYIQGGKGNGVEEDENDDGSVREDADEGGFDGDDSSVGGVDTAVRARRRGSASGRQGARRRKSGRFKQLFSALGGYSTDSSSTSTSGKHTVASTSSPRDDAIPSGERRSSASPSSWFGRMVTSGSGLGADSDDSDGDSRGSTRKKYGGDVSSVQSSVFQKIFKDSPGKGKDKDSGGKKPARRGSFSSTKSIDDDDEDVELPDQVKFAASMSHLQKLALERFSDSEDESETEDDDEDDDDDGGVKVTGSSFKHLDVGGPVQSVSGGRKPPPPPPPAVSPAGQGLPPPSGGVPGASPPSGGSPSLRRVSQILFGAGMSPSSTGTGHNDSDSSSSGSEGDSSSESEGDNADSD